VLPAVLLIVGDGVVTLLLQPAAYWTESYALAIERSPLGLRVLTTHPVAFVIFMLIWLVFIVAVVELLHRPWNRALVLTVVVGHTAGLYGWLAPRNYWATLPMFVIVGVMTTLCWSKAEEP
jgi:hypothetical protein